MSATPDRSSDPLHGWQRYADLAAFGVKCDELQANVLVEVQVFPEANELVRHLKTLTVSLHPNLV